MKKLLISGGTGFFGRSLLRYLEAVDLLQGHLDIDEVTIISRSPESFRVRFPSLSNLSWLRFHKGDVLDATTLPHKENFDLIIHAAADSTDAANLTSLQCYRQIVDGTENMLKLALSCNSQKFLLTSSGGAYGPQPAEMVTIPETYNAMPDPLNPSNAYGVGKRQAEHLCSQYSHHFGIETVIARCFAFVGEDLPKNAHFAIGNFIRDALERTEIVVNGNGTPLRSYMHQRDLAHWLLTILLNGKSGSAYNVGSDEAITIADLALLVKKILSPNKQVRIIGSALADNNYRNRYLPDIKKAKIELGLQLTVPLEKAISLSAGIGLEKSET
jgi:dTDP-glucose 4,6-dehydratase